MTRFIGAAAFAAAASAAALRRGDMNGCGFHIKSSGGLDCTMGQFEDGQNRLNGSYPVATYYFSNGGITDENGRPCIVTTTNDATHQFQCDENSPGGPTRGFTISNDRKIAYNGNTQFFACRYIDEYNVYTDKVNGQDKCLPVELSADNDCASGNGQPPSYGKPPGETPSGPGNGQPPAYSKPPAGETPVTSSPVVPTDVTVTVTTTLYMSDCPEVCSETQSLPNHPTVPTHSLRTPQSYVPGPTHSVGTPKSRSPPATYPSSTGTTPNSPNQPASTTCTETTTTPGSPIETASTVTSVVPSQSASCPAPGSTDSKGRYSCNPAHHGYPAGQTCQLEKGCYYLTTSSSTSSTPSKPTTPSSPEQPPQYGATESTPSATKPAASTSVFKSTIVVTPSSSASSTSTTPPSPTSSTPGSCGTTLEGSYQAPKLITWVSEDHPATSYGSKQNATINDECSSVFNFDIPADYKGKQCSVVFLFPEEDESKWSWNEQGSIEFNKLSGAVNGQTTYDTCPSKEQCLGTIAPKPGNSYVVSTAPCQAGETVTIETSSKDGLGLDFCEDANKPPVGVYITAC